MQLNYAPGALDGWVLFAGDTIAVLVHPAGGRRLGQAWADATSGVRAALDALTAEGIAATPEFALLDWSENSVRVIVRGGVRVAIGPDHIVDGAGVTTWTEQLVSDAARFTVSTTPMADADHWLALSSGSALAAGFVLSSEADDAEFPQVEDVEDAEKVEDVPEIAEVDGETVHRPVEEPAPAPAPMIAPPAPPAPPSSLGDHDGMTIVSGDLRKLRAERPAGVTGASAAASPVASDPEPRTLSLELSTGGTEKLASSLVIGRAPSLSKASGGALPRLVAVPGDKDISRNHVQVAVEGGAVVVTDLHSRNGTQVLMPGRAPQQLRAGEPTPVIVGTVIDLGGDVRLTVREEG